jgi:hypothetical protein
MRRSTEEARRIRGSLVGAAGLLVAVIAISGCGTATGNQSGDVRGVDDSPAAAGSVAKKTAPLPCGNWAGASGALVKSLGGRYGVVDDCAAVNGVWVMTIDRGRRGAGSILVHVCRGECSTDVPRAPSQWKKFPGGNTKGSYSRLVGANDDGTLLFKGGRGEIAFDPATGTFTSEAHHG